ncbi:MAG: helix-hairpin-helix domain-containing protein [Candidatus Geothermincolia bacterium]
MAISRRYLSWLRELPYWQLAAACLALLLALGCVVLLISRQHPREVVIQPADPEPVEQSAPLMVHVAGAVARPGIYEFEGRARVADAVLEAGGALGDADLDRVNLAARLHDGEKVNIPRIGETPAPADGDKNGPVNLNSATAAELEKIPGIGPVLSQRIIEFREEHGGFDSVQQLRQVEGIGPKKFEDLKDRVEV